MFSYTFRANDKIENKIVYNYSLATFEELAMNAIYIKNIKFMNMLIFINIKIVFHLWIIIVDFRLLS
ncbi:hypothetical protein PR254_02830, partial [Metamycoplasma hyosynoviae]|uniref:hypothetical protein n=1 Tax=Metamycoplasma hyosynoviae TaxID=29559 RepID=UPI002359E968